ncbi:MAG: phosphocarrier protein HPr [marine bacterium B5-7]|nr:MAG: phosphocarrier protein HPr [marine bacterium B5-7]
MVVEKQLEVINKLGLHARAAAKLVNTASAFGSEVWIELGGQSVNAKSIMGLMMLAAAAGTTVDLRVEGDDADEATQAISDLFADRFGEDE